MARPRKGKPLTMRVIRLDDDVWAECQRLGKEHGTINEGLRGKLFGGNAIQVTLPSRQEDDIYVVPPALKMRLKRGPRPKGDK